MSIELKVMSSSRPSVQDTLYIMYCKDDFWMTKDGLSFIPRDEMFESILSFLDLQATAQRSYFDREAIENAVEMLSYEQNTDAENGLIGFFFQNGHLHMVDGYGVISRVEMEHFDGEDMGPDFEPFYRLDVIPV